MLYNAKFNAIKDTKKVKSRLLPVPCLYNSPLPFRNNWEWPEMTLASASYPFCPLAGLADPSLGDSRMPIPRVLPRSTGGAEAWVGGILIQYLW